jgi:hypothetical protein
MKKYIVEIILERIFSLYYMLTSFCGSISNIKDDKNDIIWK